MLLLRPCDRRGRRARPADLRRHAAGADERRAAHPLRHAAEDGDPGPLGAHPQHRAPRRDRQPHPGAAARLALADRAAIPRVAGRARSMRLPTSTYRLQLRSGVRLRGRRGDRPLPRRARGRRRLRCPRSSPRRAAARTATTASIPTRIDEPRGGSAGFRALVAAARASGLGHARRHRAEPPRGERAEPLVVGCPAARTRVAPTRASSTSTGMRPASTASCCCPCSASRSPRSSPTASSRSISRIARGPVLRYFERAFPLASYTEMLELPLAELLELQHYRLADWREARS